MVREWSAPGTGGEPAVEVSAPTRALILKSTAALTGREITALHRCTHSVAQYRRRGHCRGSMGCRCVYHSDEVERGLAPCGHPGAESLPLLLRHVRRVDAGVEGVPLDWDEAVRRWRERIAARLLDLLPEQVEVVAEHGTSIPHQPSGKPHVTAVQCLAVVEGELRALAYVRAAALAELRQRGAAV